MPSDRRYQIDPSLVFTSVVIRSFEHNAGDNPGTTEDLPHNLWSDRCYGGNVRRKEARCRPRHLTLVQNDEVRRQKALFSCAMRR
ncbi:hypothetical protein TNCV_4141391 [Trichonephila clavipes]|nr:hypothetical protein TNCV_4141391 [Trichonephila clavipes]